MRRPLGIAHSALDPLVLPGDASVTASRVSTNGREWRFAMWRLSTVLLFPLCLKLFFIKHYFGPTGSFLFSCSMMLLLGLPPLQSGWPKPLWLTPF
jgi:hypothetical protein